MNTISDHKKEYGQFFTSRPVAEFMAGWVAQKQPEHILDPAAGEGIFLQVMNELLPQAVLTAYEIDPLMAERLEKKCLFQKQLYIKDYLSVQNCSQPVSENPIKRDEKGRQDIIMQYDGIICNPPYHKFQMIPDREQIRKNFSQWYGICLSGYSNASSYFLIKSIHELAPGGRCAYIMPYEFLNTGYGEAIKQCLLDQKVLRYLIKFDSSVRVFEDAATTCCILLLEKPDKDIKEDSLKEEAVFSELCAVEQLNWDYIRKNSTGIPWNRLDYREKWISYFIKESIVTKGENLIQLKTVARISRGIATGSNQFFALSKDMIEERGLSREVCVPCVTKAPDIKELIFHEGIYRSLYEENKKVTIFFGENAHTKQDKEYICYGEQQKVDQTYLTSHRTPWYAIEKRAAAPIWIAVFCRDRIKVIRNEMMALNLTTFHGIYIDEKQFSPEDIDLLFCWLLTPTAQNILRENKREYGDGLDKFEPGDLMEAYILDVRKMKPADRKKVLQYYEKLFCAAGTGGHNPEIRSIDKIMKRYIVMSDN